MLPLRENIGYGKRHGSKRTADFDQEEPAGSLAGLPSQGESSKSLMKIDLHQLGTPGFEPRTLRSFRSNIPAFPKISRSVHGVRFADKQPAILG